MNSEHKTNPFLTSPDDDQPGSKQYVVFEEKGICTLFRIDKQGNSLGEIKTYFASNVNITNPILSTYLAL